MPWEFSNWGVLSPYQQHVGLYTLSIVQKADNFWTLSVFHEVKSVENYWCKGSMTHLSFSVLKRTFLKTTRKSGSWEIGRYVHLRYPFLDPPHQLLQVLCKQVDGMIGYSCLLL